MTNRIERISNILLKAAEAQVPVRRFKHTAAVIHKNRIISIGMNSLKSNPFQLKYGRNNESIYLHAEVAAIKNALKRVRADFLKRCTLISVRRRPDGSIGISKPCAGCERCIAEFGIKNVFWTNEHGLIEGY
jgi:tRNA(Arg) A34 adenosine deaminase TadA